MHQRPQLKISPRLAGFGIGICSSNIAAVMINNVQRPEARPRGNVPPPPLIFAGQSQSRSSCVMIQTTSRPAITKPMPSSSSRASTLPSSGVIGCCSCIALLVAKLWPVDRHGTVWHETCSRINVCEISMPSPSSSAQKR